MCQVTSFDLGKRQSSLLYDFMTSFRIVFDEKNGILLGSTLNPERQNLEPRPETPTCFLGVCWSKARPGFSELLGWRRATKERPIGFGSQP